MPALFHRTFILILVTTLANAEATAQKIYKTPSGKKYHLGSCHMVENVSEEITLDRASELGLGPCAICKPELVLKQNIIPGNTPRGKQPTVQCKGITQTGTRCKHMTSMGNGYCYQHNPDKKK